MRGTLSKLVLLSVMLGFAGDTEGRKATTIMVSGGSIDVFAPREKGGVAYEDLIQWVNAASKSVATYFGRYPVPHAEVRITTTEGRGVHHGMTFGSPSVRISISVGRDTDLTDLKRDWTMTHEMVHLAFPSMAERHHWIEEGTATYVEPVARVQAGAGPSFACLRTWRSTSEHTIKRALRMPCEEFSPPVATLPKIGH